MKMIEKSPAIYAYECEKCGTQFNTENEALLCEKSHTPSIGLTSEKFEYENKYPVSVNVRMSDSTIQTYNKKQDIFTDITHNVTTNGETVLAIVHGYNVLVQKEYVKDEEVIVEKLTGVNVKLLDRKLHVDIPDEVSVSSTDTICVKVFDEEGNELVADAENPIYDEVIITAEIKTVVNNSECIVPKESNSNE